MHCLVPPEQCYIVMTINRHLCLDPDFNVNAFNISPLSRSWNRYIYFIMLRKYSSLTILWSFKINNRYWIFMRNKCLLSICRNHYTSFLFKSIDLRNYISQLPNTKLPLSSWNWYWCILFLMYLWDSAW